MLIALTLGLMVLAIVISVFWNTLGANNRELLTARLVQELRAVTDMMVRDLKRAGYWSLAKVAIRPDADLEVAGTSITIDSSGTAFSDWALGPNAVAPVGLSVVGENGRADIMAYSGGDVVTVSIVSPFSANPIPAGAWTLHSFSSDWFSVIDVASDCVLYRTDLDSDLVVGPNERFGFRLKDGAIQRYETGVHACDDGVWGSITDAAVLRIVSLSFSTAGYRTIGDGGNTGLIVREIGIFITAELQSDPFIARTIQTSVHPRANLYMPDLLP